MSPKLKEMHQRHSLYYHTPNHPSDENKLVIGYTVDDAVYGQMYFEYGRPTDRQDRRIVAPQVEKTMLSHEPDTVMVLLRADPDVIRGRMKTDPHDNGVLQGGRHRVRGRAVRPGVQILPGDSGKLTLDTTSSTPTDTLTEFAEKIRPLPDRRGPIAHPDAQGAGRMRASVPGTPPPSFPARL